MTTAISCQCGHVKLKFPSCCPRAVTECCCNHCWARVQHLHEKGGPSIPFKPIITSKWDNCIQVTTGSDSLGAFKLLADGNVVNIYATCCHTFLLGRNATYDANCVTVVNDCVVFHTSTNDCNTATSRWFTNQWDSKLLSKFPPLVGIWVDESDGTLLGEDGWEQVFEKMKDDMERDIPQIEDSSYQTFDEILVDYCGELDVVYKDRSMFPNWPFDAMMEAASGDA